MSISRLSALAAIILGLIAGVAMQMLPAAPASMMSAVGEPNTIIAMVFGDRVVRIAFSAAAFAIVFGLVSFLCQLAFVVQPLASTTQRLLDKGAHGSVATADDVLDTVTSLSGLRDQLASLRSQFSSQAGSAMMLSPAHLAFPAQQIVSASHLADTATPSWLSRMFVAGCGVLAVVMLAWALATGANAQALAIFDPALGHAEGLMLGMRTGGVAVAICLLGGLVCHGLTTAALGISTTHVERFLAAVNTVVTIKTNVSTPDAMSDALELVSLDPTNTALGTAAALEQLQPLIDKLVTAQNLQYEKVSTQMSASTATLAETVTQNQAQSAALTAETRQVLTGATQSMLAGLRDIPEALDALATTLGGSLRGHDTDQAVLKDIAASLSAVRDSLDQLQKVPRQHPTVAGGGMIPANTDVARRLSSAMQNLRDATEHGLNAG